MKNAGFEDIHHENYLLPTGLWAKDPYLISPIV